ncbi:3-isopropylmalate dehydratase [Candidatus Woesearchaeota archaeon]|nr:3-isopropylmalate dehydratase [Candidatus Woesearchaeota archaeon]
MLALKVGDHVNTDMIVPGRYLAILDPEELAKHVLESLDMPARIRPGDVLIAGHNFGCGSSREHAPIALKAAGISAVLAESFARIFFRNAINVGLPVIVCPGISRLPDGCEIEVVGRVVRAAGLELPFVPLSAEVQEILDAGGLVEMVRRRLA